MEVLLSACAFIWHVGDAIVGTKNKKKTRTFITGVGVGWSAFFLAYNVYKYYTQTRYIETKDPDKLV